MQMQMQMQMPYAEPDGHLVLPPTGKGSAVLVLHAWWGLNDTIRAFCTQLAEAGFLVFAPDLYHGNVADNIADAERLGKALDAEYQRAKAEIVEATSFLIERAGEADTGVAVIGFSLGAYYALTSRPLNPSAFILSSSFMGPGAATGASREPPISVTLPRWTSSSRNPTSTISRRPCGALAAR